MNDLPREARWSLIAAVVLGMFLAGLGAGTVFGSWGFASATGPAKVRAATDSDALNVQQSGAGAGIRSATTGGYAGDFSSQQSDATVSITADGASFGVYAANDGAAASGGGAVRAQGEQNDGIVATSDGAQSAAIRGQNSAPNGIAIWGSNSGTGIGVFGVASGSTGSQGASVGVAGQAGPVDGIGVYGLNQSGGQAGYFAGDVTVTRDLDVRGAVIGFTAVPAVNVGTVTMHRGDAVAILGARHGPSGTYLLLVAPASKGQAVIGIVDHAVEVTTIPAPAAKQNALGVWVSGSYDATVTTGVGDSVTPGSSLLVATDGLFSTANVSATASPVVVGDLLVAGDTPGQLVPAGTSPVAGTVLGFALFGVASGTALIPVLIQPR